MADLGLSLNLRGQDGEASRAQSLPRAESPSENLSSSLSGEDLERHDSGSTESTVSGYDPLRNSTTLERPESRAPTPVSGAAHPPQPLSPTHITHASNDSQPEASRTHRSLRRALHGYHIFLIAISAVVGMGYYVRTGELLHIGGQAAVVYTYAFLGILSLMVMRGLTTMLRIWPIGGALIVFVEEFVDKDVANSVAILYWLTYCFSFASLTTTIGSLVDYWSPGTSVSVGLSVVFVCLPILANLTDIRVFRKIELFLGLLKLALALVLILMMNVINPTVGGDATAPASSSLESRDVVFQSSLPPAGGWFAALLTSMFVGSFSFVGIEVIAATAQEAVFKNNRDRTNSPNDAAPHAADHPPPPPLPAPNGLDQTSESSGLLDTTKDNPFEYAIWVPVAATFIYLWGGWIVSHNVPWDDDSLPALSWSSKSQKSGGSIFVTSGERYSETMGTAVTILLLLNVASTSSTALANDSRFSWFLTAMSWLSVKSKFDVPYRAVLVSSWLLWLPFLKYLKSPGTYLSAIDVVSEMASVSCILVWAFVSLAAFHFYGCLKHGGNTEPETRLKLIATVDDEAWYFSYRAMSALSAALCFAVIIIGGIMTVFSNPVIFQGVAAFLIIGVFMVLTYIPKLTWSAGRNYRWRWARYGVMLEPADFGDIVLRLDNHLKHNTEGTHEGKIRRKRDIFGIINSEWFLEKIERCLMPNNRR